MIRLTDNENAVDINTISLWVDDVYYPYPDTH